MKKKKEYKIEGRPKTIYRVVKNPDNPFVMIDRRPVDNPSLSFKAKGILTYLMARPDGWEVSVTDLVNHAADGVDSVRSGLSELKKAGHIKQVTARQQGRITGWLIEVYEVPLMDLPDVEKPHVEKPHVENPTQLLSKSNKNKEKKKVNRDDSSLSALEIKREFEGELLTGWTRKLGEEIAGYPLTWLHDAVLIAVTSNVRKWRYVLAVLKNWKVEGHQTRAEKVEQARRGGR